MELYRSVLRVYENSVYGRVFTAEWCIVMRVIPRRIPSVQGATGLPRMCTQPVGDVWAHRHVPLQLRTAAVHKFRWWQSVHRRVVHCHECLSESYT